MADSAKPCAINWLRKRPNHSGPPSHLEHSRHQTSGRLRQLNLMAASALLLLAGGAVGWIAKSEWPARNGIQGVMVSDAISAYRT